MNYQYGSEGYSAQQPPPSVIPNHHPSQIPPRNMNTFVSNKQNHPYNSYYDGANEYNMYGHGGVAMASPMRQPPDMNPYMQSQAPPQAIRQSTMNPNAAVFMPRNYDTRIMQPTSNYSPLGYGGAPTHRQIPQQVPQQSQAYSRPTNFLGYPQSRNNAQPDYASITGSFIPHHQQQPQRIPPPAQVQQQQPPQQSQQSSQQQGQGQDLLSGLRMSLAEQKQQTDDHLKRQQRDQEEYASKFLAAVQERVLAQPRPSSASAASNISNGVANGPMNGTSLQNLASTLQEQGANGGYFDQDISTYDFEAQHNANPPFQLSQDLLEKIESLQNKLVLFEVQIGLEQLLAEPSEFDAWIVAIRDRLAAKDVTQEDLEVAAWLIIEMGINSEGAQYNFARVCTYLYERLAAFKDSLIYQMQEFHAFRSQLPLDTFQNLLVFTAELYEQAYAPVGVRNHPIPTALYEELCDILKTEPMTDGIIKKIVHTLKLCGRHLETDVGKENMEELFTKLNTFCSDEGRPKGLSDTGAGFITNLMMYRQSGWGGANDNSSATSAPIRFAPEVNNAMELTEEEIRFLESNGAMEGSSFNSGTSSNDPYDAEILEDYEKFLRDHAEHTAISAAEKALERWSMDDDFPDEHQERHRDDNATPTPSKS